MKTLTEAMASYIDRHTKTTIPKSVPIQATTVEDVPVPTSTKWQKLNNNTLTKKFKFTSLDKRIVFCQLVMTYESEMKRSFVWKIDFLTVELTIPPQFNVVADKELQSARYIDRVHRDVEFSEKLY